MKDLKNFKLSEVQEINDFTNVIRVEKGVIYFFHQNNKVTNSCFVELKDDFFNETRSMNKVEIR